ncbi:MAG: hypothetical protein KAI25_05275, partial [Hyphomicrobiaceae bacterium]|nr:hypothetical protein [Hyphomicrobiaceae bacterium]
GVNVNTSDLDIGPTVTAYIDAGLATAGTDVSIVSTSNTNTQTSVSNATGGFVGVGDPDTNATQTNNSEAYVDTGTRIIADENFTMEATSLTQSHINSRADTGGFVGVANADANSTLAYSTTATVKDGAEVLAGDTAHVTTESRAVQYATGKGIGIGFGGDGDADATANISSALTQVEIAANAALFGREVELSALVPQMIVRADADGRGGGFVAIGGAEADVSINTDNNILLGGNSSVTGFEGVDFLAKFSGVNTFAKAFARATGLFGHVDADADNTTRLDTLVSGAAGALVTAGPREDTETSLETSGESDHLAFFVDVNNVIGPNDVDEDATVSRRSLATGGADSDNPQLLGDQKIDFNSDVL